MTTRPVVQLISEALFNSVEAAAAKSRRRRMNHNFHSGPDDNPHRFLNVLLQGTYIRPHRHLTPPKSESFLVLDGAVDVILFDDQGAITARHRLGTETAQGRLWGIDVPPGLWHTIIARTSRAVCFEVKPGPWDAPSDKEFAEWAPKEDDPCAPSYLEALTEA